MLAKAASCIGDVQVRNRGTIGGSIAHADPAADYLPVMLAIGATLRTVGPSGERAIPAQDFFLGVMATVLEPGELLVEIELPKLPEGAGSAYLRLARLEGSFAIANAAAVVDGARVEACGRRGDARAVPRLTRRLRSALEEIEQSGIRGGCERFR